MYYIIRHFPQTVAITVQRGIPVINSVLSDEDFSWQYVFQEQTFLHCFEVGDKTWGRFIGFHFHYTIAGEAGVNIMCFLQCFTIIRASLFVITVARPETTLGCKHVRALLFSRLPSLPVGGIVYNPEMEGLLASHRLASEKWAPYLDHAVRQVSCVVWPLHLWKYTNLSGKPHPTLLEAQLHGICAGLR